VLFNNAGLVTGGLLEEQDIDQLYTMFQVSLVGVAHLSARVMSVRRAISRVMTASEGRQPFGKMWVFMNDFEAFSTS
jgi:NADP-dependent 3-hydroxy acid dehydrogenase YdfG